MWSRERLLIHTHGSTPEVSNMIDSDNVLDSLDSLDSRVFHIGMWPKIGVKMAGK